MTSVPAPVASVLQLAAAGRLLGDVDRVAAALRSSGWTRGTSGGVWELAPHPRWSIVTGWSAAHVSVFSGGDREHPVPLSDLQTVADQLAVLADAAPALRPGVPDPDWRSWVGDEVHVDLGTSPEKDLGTVVVPAVLQLVLESSPAQDVPLDPDAARRTAVDGSSDARWTLAGERDLPDEVVALLASSDDPAVVSALGARE